MCAGVIRRALRRVGIFISRCSPCSSSAQAAPPAFLQPARPALPAPTLIQANASGCGRANSPQPWRWPGQCCSIISSFVSHHFILPGWSTDASAAAPEEGLPWTSSEGVPSAAPTPPAGPTVPGQRAPRGNGLRPAASPLPPPAACASSQGHRVQCVGTRTLGRAISEQRTDAGLCFTADGQQFPLLQRHAEKEN